MNTKSLSNLFFLTSIAFMGTACESIKGTFEVTKTLKVRQNKETVSVKPGIYDGKMAMHSDKKLSFELQERSDQDSKLKFTLSLPKSTRVSYYGAGLNSIYLEKNKKRTEELNIDADEIGQDFDLSINVDTKMISESKNRDRMNCDIPGPSVTRCSTDQSTGEKTCREITNTIHGTKEVETTVTTYQYGIVIQFKDPKSHEVIVGMNSTHFDDQYHTQDLSDCRRLP